MKVGFCLVLVALAALSWSANASCPAIQLLTPWVGGRNAMAKFQAPSNLDGWKLVVKFDRPVYQIRPYQGRNVRCSGSKITCSFSNVWYNKRQSQGSSMSLEFGIDYNNNAPSPQIVSAMIVSNNGRRFNLCKSSPRPNPTPSPTRPPTRPPRPTRRPSRTTRPTYPTTTTKSSGGSGKCNTVTSNYKEVIKKSLLFYEAQRSGKLPANNRVPWRKDSALRDGSDVGMDLTGGYYDAGDYVKFGFPMAYTITTLAWGGITFKKGYESAGQLGYLKDALKWGTDYFIKCHPQPNVLWGQVGDGDADHAWVGRPEDMTMRRPSFKIDPQNPGSDLAGETAAAMAATAIVFQDSDPSYSSELISHAKDLFNFADKYRRAYHQSIPNAAKFYQSWSGYNDELVWAAIWLYKATKEGKYLQKAKSMYDVFGLNGQKGVFSWDDKKVGVHALMAEALPNVAKYKTSLQGFCDHAISGQKKSPKGQLFYMQWGSLRYASNAAFICLQAAELIPSKDKAYTELAKGQMDYILGKNGRSFVVGYGPNYPKKPHHRASTCPDAPAYCGWSTFKGQQPNAHVLEGALVGGPPADNDQFNDDRNDYIASEVATDYNAGFQGVLAGLQMKKCM